MKGHLWMPKQLTLPLLLYFPLQLKGLKRKRERCKAQMIQMLQDYQV